MTEVKTLHYTLFICGLRDFTREKGGGGPNDNLIVWGMEGSSVCFQQARSLIDLPPSHFFFWQQTIFLKF